MPVPLRWLPWLRTVGAEGASAATVRGRRAEQVAALFLEFTGWCILGRNIHGGRGRGVGEVDIVARRGELVVFVEVKSRDRLSDALSAVSVAQCRRLERAAESWLSNHPDSSIQAVRFDVIVVPKSGYPHHIPDAWRPWG